MGSRKIRELNRQFLGHDRPTDVIAFDLRDTAVPVLPAVEPELVGELYVCPTVAQAAARVHRTSVDYEVMLYIVHGLLHLAGYDDSRPVARARMRAAERRTMARLQRGTCLDGIFEAEAAAGTARPLPVASRSAAGAQAPRTTGLNGKARGRRQMQVPAADTIATQQPAKDTRFP